MLHRQWRIKYLRIQRNKNYFCNVLHPFDTETYVVLLGNWKNSNEAHLSTVKAAIQYSVTVLQSQDDFSPDFEPSDEEDVYSCLQNPTKTPVISKDFRRVLPLCPIIHWVSQMCNNPKLCFCPCSISSQQCREKMISLLMMIMDARQLP
jgi:hypothetical protein